MAYNQTRSSTLTSTSNHILRPAKSLALSNQALLEALHTSYNASKPYPLDATTSLVVNTYLSTLTSGTDGNQPVVDEDLAKKAWEHARRRAEDGCIILSNLHHSSPALLTSFLSILPFTVPPIIYTALSVIEPFLQCLTPQNPATRRSPIAITFGVAPGTGIVGNASLKLSARDIDTTTGLINISAEHGHRAFDVFYYLLSSAASQKEKESLGLQDPSSYFLLKKSGTFEPPSYIPTVDDAAAADDFRAALKSIGISGSARRGLLSVLAALLKIGETLDPLISDEQLESLCEEAAIILDVDPTVLARHFSAHDRQLLIEEIYQALVEWVVSQANQAIAREFTNYNDLEDAEFVSLTILEVADTALGKALALRTVFDEAEGINSEVKEDGLTIPPVPHPVLVEMRASVVEYERKLGIEAVDTVLEELPSADSRQMVLDRISQTAETGSFFRALRSCDTGDSGVRSITDPLNLTTLVASSRTWFHLNLHPTDEDPAKLAGGGQMPWSAGSLSRQLRSWRLTEWVNWRTKVLDFTADFDHDDFSTRYARLGCGSGREEIENFLLQRGWNNGGAVLGNDRVWLCEDSWWEVESMMDLVSSQNLSPGTMAVQGGVYDDEAQDLQDSYFGSPYGGLATPQDSREDLLQNSQNFDARSGFGGRSLAPTVIRNTRGQSSGDYGLGKSGDDRRYDQDYDDDEEMGAAKVIVEQPITRSRRLWIALTWALTFWIPSFVLRYVGRMKRPDVRMAWREKVALVSIILFINSLIVFYIIVFGKLLCPNYDKVWTNSQVSQHQGQDDFYVSVRGRVYDISKFWKLQHSSVAGIQVSSELMRPLAGLNLNELFPIPLYVGCSGLVTDQTVLLQNNDSTLASSSFVHTSGYLSPYTSSDLADGDWYYKTFLPRMTGYKGDLVISKKTIQSEGSNDSHMWVIINDQVFDLTDYYYTLTLLGSVANYNFLDDTLVTLIQDNPGTDITPQYNAWFQQNSSVAYENLKCLQNVFYVGRIDFRSSPKCQVNNYILLAFTIVLCAVILVKFFAALQFGSKRRPAAQDKFVICQVPAYSEGEEHLRKGLDSLTSLAYDNKRKLICVICDGVVTGGGNDRPTPKTVLDILGVDPKIDPPALPFRSVGQGNEQLNYGKVYSGLYEHEGNVVPYLVVVKVGKESEQAKVKPGNRGKRDSQILLMSFLNRVHYRAPMSPLELEMFHQINNIIGVDPELYEYLFMVDADTMVMEDSLTRLVASCANDAKIAGICGETSLENEGRSWWTMIQVYEYFISHHLAKAFESLFGSVTCLPGCFCMYRLRTADKGKPLLISDAVIREYSDCDVDTLHKKNLLSLGEDRYLTTLMTKHFPNMSFKFVPDASALTAAPESFSILLSQRRRWINSTIHNLAELVFLKDMCGFCCFSMRFVVLIDLFGTIILPATCCYLAYLIYRAATHEGAFPLVSIIMLAGVYGLQALIFLLKRQWQHIGWMIIYLLAFPIYSFILPVYSFWKQDDFSWGNTRVVIGEKGGKQVIAEDQEKFDSRMIPLQRWDDYAAVNGLPGQRGLPETEKEDYEPYDDGYEMDEIRSQYSAVRPTSTILTGLKSHNASLYLPPQSPAPMHSRPQLQQHQSSYSQFARYTDNVNQNIPPQHSRQTSDSHNESLGPRRSEMSPSPTRRQSSYHFNGGQSGRLTPFTEYNVGNRRSHTPLGYGRPGSAANLLPDYQQDTTRSASVNSPNDAQIIEVVQSCLASVDLDIVTKKQLRALAEQRLQCQLGPERRIFLDEMIDAELAVM